MATRIGDRAVVLGGSLAGLLAARVLAEAYRQVVVVERDDLAATGTHRRGVPQGRHVHGLLARGQQGLDELFPGLTAGLVAAGAAAGDMLADTRLCFSGHRLGRADSGLLVLCASRPFLEGHVRSRVRAMPQVTFVDRCDVVGLATTPDRRRVTGARLFRRADGSAEEVLAADLVVDATGRGSRTPVWLETLGYPRPQRDQVRIGLGYATRTYRLRGDALAGDLAVITAATPPYPRAGALQAIEGGRAMVTLAGILGDHPPTDPEGFLDFARTLQFPDIHRAISDAEPLDDPVPFRFPASVRTRYERLARCPDGLLVLGDAVCSFNPIYGQGITVAVQEALTLRSHLRRGVRPTPRHFFRDISRVVDVPWEMGAGGDLSFPDVPGRRTPKVRLVGAYLARLHAAAADDPGLAVAFLRVAGLVAHPGSLLRPGTVWRVLRHRQFPSVAATGRRRGRDMSLSAAEHRKEPLQDVHGDPGGG